MQKLTASSENISAVAKLLKNGGVIVYPTETVYGLGALSTDFSAIERLAALKGGRPNSPFLILIKGKDDIRSYARNMPPLALKLADHFWPGPLTLVVPADDRLHPRFVGPSGGVGLRVSSHPWCRMLLRHLGCGLVSTSANPAGFPPPRSLEMLHSRVAKAADLVLDGGLLPGVVSTVLDLCVKPALIRRAGAIAQADIEQFIGEKIDARPPRGVSV